MSDPFVERMMERARKRREALGHIPSSGPDKENTGLTSTTRSSLKSISDRYTDDSNKSAVPFKSSENTEAAVTRTLSTSKRPTNLDSVLAASRSVVGPSQGSDQLSPSSTNRPRLGILAARCQQVRDWDDDDKHISSTSKHGNVGAAHVEVLERNEALPKETKCKPCAVNEMHDPGALHSSANIDGDVSSVANSKNTVPVSTCPDTPKYLFGDKVSKNKDKSVSPTKLSPTKPNMCSVTNNTEPRSLASIISPKKSSNISASTTPKFKTPVAGTKPRCSSNSELKQISASGSAKKIELDQSLINSLECQGFTPSDSHSRLVFDFKKEKSSSTDSKHQNWPQPPSPPPLPKVVKCVPKSPKHSPERNLTTASLKERTRSPSPSKVIEMRSRWEQHIRKASPDRQEHRSHSPTKISNYTAGSKSASNLKQEHRSRSPVKSASNLSAPYRSQSPVKSGPFSSQSAVKSTSPTHFSSGSPQKPPTSEFTVVKGDAPMPETTPLLDDAYHSSVKDRAAAFRGERTRSLSPSKVVGMRSRWEQHIKKSSPDRQEHRSHSPTKISNHTAGSKSASNLKQEHRSRSPVKSASNHSAPYRSQSPVKSGPFSSQSAVKSTSPTRFSSGSPQKPPTSEFTVVKGDAPMPETIPLLDDPYHSSVKDRAAAFGGAGTKKDSRDPTEMTLQERRILFEKQKGAALVPKAPFGQAIPTKVLQGEIVSKGSQGNGVSSLAHSQPVKKPAKRLATEPAIATAERMEEFQRAEDRVGGVSSFDVQRRMFESHKDNWQDTEINNKVQQQRQKEIEVLMNRFKRPASLSEDTTAAADNPQISTIQRSATHLQQTKLPGQIKFQEEEYEDDEYEESDISLAESNTSEDPTAPMGPPKPPRLYSGSDSSVSGGSPQSVPLPPPPPPPLPIPSSTSPSCSPSRKTEKSSPRRRSAKRLNSTEIGEDFELHSRKGLFVPKVKPGCLFPSLSDIESHSEAPDSQESDDDDYDIKDSSFAESVLTVASMHSLGHKIQVAAQKSNSSIVGKDLTTITEYSEGYHSTISKSPSKFEDPTISESAMDACLAIDDAIDEALTPTPPKRIRSDEDTSSSYKTPRMSNTSPDRNSGYKTPLLHTGSITEENENTLTHSVSLYRKQRPIEVTYTPVRKIVRNDIRSPSPEPMDSPTVTISARIKELQEEVGAQQRVISQASQAVSVVLNKPETLEGTIEHIEAEKLLLMASLKRHQALNEIQRIKAEGALGQQDLDSCSGSISISNISLPLKQDFLQKGMKGDKIHHILVLVKHRHQVMASQLMTTPSCVRDGQITFPNLMEFNNISSDFNIAIEVYDFSTFTHNQHNMKKEQSRMKLTPLKRLSKQDSRCCSPAVQSPGGPYAVRSSAFTLMGFTNLNIATVTRNAWTLEKVVFSSPLDGHLLMNVQCNMEGGITERGFLTMFEDVGGFGAWNRRWCVLNGKYLRYWSYPDDENKREASGSIDLRSCTNRRIELVARDVCARQHTFHLTCQRSARKGDISNLVQEVQGDIVVAKFLLSADCKEERILWCNKLNKIVANIRAWDPDALRPEDYQV